MIAIEKLAEVFVEVADTLVVDFDIVDFLQMVTTRSADMTRAEAAGLLLANERNQLHFMAASQESVAPRALPAAVGGGAVPRLLRYGAPVSNADLHRRPNAGHGSRRGGPGRVHRGACFPLRHRNKVIGALNLFSTTKVRIDANDGQAHPGPRDATIGLLQQRAIVHGEILTEQLQIALRSRVAIEQAKGHWRACVAFPWTRRSP